MRRSDGPSSGGAKENKAEGKAKEGKAKAGDAKESASPAAPPKPQLKQMTLNFGCKPSAPPESAEPSKSAKGAAHQADAATESAQSPPKKKAKGSSGTATKALSAEDKLWSDWSAALASLDESCRGTPPRRLWLGVTLPGDTGAPSAARGAPAGDRGRALAW